MVTLELQICLAAEVENITKDMLFQNPAGKETKLKAYLQSLPEKQAVTWEEQREECTDGEDSPYPYCIVRIDSGEFTDMASPQIVKVFLIFGLYNSGMEAQGHARILTIIQRISERFRKDPVLNGQFVAQTSCKWTLQDEDEYPYYFGGMEMAWETAAIEREGKFI